MIWGVLRRTRMTRTLALKIQLITRQFQEGRTALSINTIMSLELTIHFNDAIWYKEHRQQIAAKIRALPSFVKQADTNEFWLKDKKYLNPWDFDVRMFLQLNFVFLEVSAFSNAFYSDVKHFYEMLLTDTGLTIIDEDGEPFAFS
jgi:hypothetical protein